MVRLVKLLGWLEHRRFHRGLTASALADCAVSISHLSTARAHVADISSAGANQQMPFPSGAARSVMQALLPRATALTHTRFILPQIHSLLWAHQRLQWLDDEAIRALSLRATIYRYVAPLRPLNDVVSLMAVHGYHNLALTEEWYVKVTAAVDQLNTCNNIPSPSGGSSRSGVGELELLGLRPSSVPLSAVLRCAHRLSTYTPKGSGLSQKQVIKLVHQVDWVQYCKHWGYVREMGSTKVGGSKEFGSEEELRSVVHELGKFDHLFAAHVARNHVVNAFPFAAVDMDAMKGNSGSGGDGVIRGKLAARDLLQEELVSLSKALLNVSAGSDSGSGSGTGTGTDHHVEDRRSLVRGDRRQLLEQLLVLTRHLPSHESYRAHARHISVVLAVCVARSTRKSTGTGPCTEGTRNPLEFDVADELTEEEWFLIDETVRALGRPCFQCSDVRWGRSLCVCAHIHVLRRSVG